MTIAVDLGRKATKQTKINRTNHALMGINCICLKSSHNVIGI